MPGSTRGGGGESPVQKDLEDGQGIGAWHEITQEHGDPVRLFSREPSRGQGGVTDGLQGKGAF